MMKAVLILVLGKFASVSCLFSLTCLLWIDAESFLDRLVGSDRETLAVLRRSRLDKPFALYRYFLCLLIGFNREFLFPLAVFLSRFDYVVNLVVFFGVVFTSGLKVRFTF